MLRKKPATRISSEIYPIIWNDHDYCIGSTILDDTQQNGSVSDVYKMSGLHQKMSALLILRWRHNGRDGVSNHQPHDCLLNRLFRRRSKKTSKLRVTGLCAGNSPGTGEFPAQMASNAENVSISWRHHDERENDVSTWLIYSVIR